MKITDLLCLQGIDMNGEVANKEEAIDHLVDLMVGTGNISDKLAFKKGILARRSSKYNGNWRRNCNPACPSSSSKKTWTSSNDS